MANYWLYFPSLVAAVIAIPFWTAGCKRVAVETECASDADCKAGLKCKNGVCVSSSDGDADSDVDGDADSDGDGDSDGDCDSAVEGSSDWGYECEFNSDCEEEGLVCLHLPIEGGAEDRGYCTPVCCDLFEMDEDFCTDVAGGQEMCLIFKGEFDDPEKRWCAITCEEGNDDDCPKGHVCLGYDNPLEKGICYPPEQ